MVLLLWILPLLVPLAMRVMILPRMLVVRYGRRRVWVWVVWRWV